jgi:hypothetical protein
VQAARRHLAARPQAVDRAATPGVHGDAAHVVVHGGPHRDRLDRRIDTGSAAARGYAGEVPGEVRPQRLARIEEDAMAGGDVSGHGARDDVARLELGATMTRHEPAAGFIHQHRALAAHRLADQRHGIEPDGKRGGMELHELHVGQRRTGAGGQRHALADGAQRIGRLGIEAAQPAGGEHDATGRQQAGAPRPRRQHARDAAIVDQQAPRLEAFDDGDRRRGRHRGDQRAHDRRPCAVARDGRCGGGGARPPARAKWPWASRSKATP